MIKFFRGLSLNTRLLLIGIIPVLLLLYFLNDIIAQKKQKLDLLEDYLDQVNISKQISDLNESLGTEGRFSYQYLLGKEDYRNIKAQRKKTDSIIRQMKNSTNLALENFTSYTFLDQLQPIRQMIDSNRNLDPNIVTDYFTRCVFRLNFLGGGIPQSDIYLKENYQKLVSQRLLVQMITFLNILRNNIFNALYTQKYMVETLMGSYGVYTTYNSFLKEFDVKATDSARKAVDSFINTPDYKNMSRYLDNLFASFRFDSSLDASQWWALSSTGLNGLKRLQKSLWKNVEQQLSILYKKEKANILFSIVIMIVVSILIVIFILFTIRSIRQQLRELKFAAESIARGKTETKLTEIPSGLVGSLARSILEIEKNYLVLAHAAGEIGKGNFDVTIKPRSDEDTLAISLKKMKQDLRKFNEQKDQLQKETLELVSQRDELFSMASHELKTPVTTIKAFAYLLQMEFKKMTEEQQQEMLVKLEKQIDKLKLLIEDLLDISRFQYNQLVYNKVVTNVGKIIADAVNEAQLANPGRHIVLQKYTDVNVCADPLRIGQVINNLLSNAIKYAPQDKDIIVTVDKTNRIMIASVLDFGCGIPVEQQEKVFERFYRVHSDKLKTYPGLGMGLFISKQIVANHGGKIWIESDDGHYCKFYFELPLN